MRSDAGESEEGLRVDLIETRSRYGFEENEVAPLNEFYEDNSSSSTWLKSKLVDPLLRWSDKRDIALFTVEFSAIQDLRSDLSDVEDYDDSAPDAYTFRPNFWANSQLVGLESYQVVKDAYVRALGETKQIGSAMADPNFFDFLYVHSRLDTSHLFSAELRNQLDRAAIFKEIPAPLFRKEKLHLKNPKCRVEGVLVNRQEAEENGLKLLEFFKKHHADFFPILLNSFEQHEIKLPFNSLHYMAVPFMRLSRHSTKPHDSDRISLEGAGCMYLTFGILRAASRNDTRVVEAAEDQDRPVQSLRSRIDLIATELKQFCLSVCAHQGYSYAETAREQTKQTIESLSAYDSVGHMIRAFVIATGYESASRSLTELRNELHRNAVDTDNKDLLKDVEVLNNAKSSLDLFRHIESLGSLFRLHGIAVRVKQGKETRDALKIKQLYDEESLQKMEDGEFSRDVLEDEFASAAELFFSPLLHKEEDLTLQIISTGSGKKLILDHDTAQNKVGRRSFHIKPLSRKNTGSNAILLSIVATLVEPFRNAVSHLNESRCDARDKVIDIYVSAKTGRRYDVWISNKWLDATKPAPEDVSQISGGLRLSNVLLNDVGLGQISGEPFDCPEDQSPRAWVKIRFTPIKAYRKFVSQ